MLAKNIKIHINYIKKNFDERNIAAKVFSYLVNNMQILLTSEEKQLVKKIQLLKFLAILICFSWFMQKKKKKNPFI